MRATSPNFFQQTQLTQLTRPWKKYRDGTLFYGQSKVGNKRLPLTTKDGNKSMYKGTRSSGIGRHTKFGDYKINWDRVRTYVVPKNFNTDLKPLLSHNLPELKHQFSGYQKGYTDPKLYFEKLEKYVNKGKVQSEASNVDCYTERG